jgi:hypothetical protein
MKPRVTLVLLVFLFSSFVVAEPRARAVDVVSAWNMAALAAIRVERTAPPIASRALAMLHAAIFDSVNGIARTYAHYVVPSTVSAGASLTAAGNAAAHRVLQALFPAQAAQFDALYATLTSTDADSPQTRTGRAWGEFVASRTLEWRANDGAAAPVEMPAHTGPGAWIPTPPAFANYALPQWAFLEPFAMEMSEAFRPGGPPALESAEYAAEYDEVKALGAATGSTRTDDQSQVALFWADGAGTETPPGHWNSIARLVSDDLETPLVEKARLFALLNIAMADAAICAWDAKYIYWFWRPVTAIRQGDTDGNADTAGDPAWSSFVVTPPFPDYVSGHSTFSGAAATVLAVFFGTDEVAFTAYSDFMPGVARTFERFSDAAAEAALSRLYGGIHFRSANEDGLRAGIDIGAWTMANVMTRKGNRSRRN